MDILSKLCREAMLAYTVRNSSSTITSGCPMYLYPSDLSQLVQQFDEMQKQNSLLQSHINDLEAALDANHIAYEGLDDD